MIETLSEDSNLYSSLLIHCTILWHVLNPESRSDHLTLRAMYSLHPVFRKYLLPEEPGSLTTFSWPRSVPINVLLGERAATPSEMITIRASPTKPNFSSEHTVIVRHAVIDCESFKPPALKEYHFKISKLLNTQTQISSVYELFTKIDILVDKCYKYLYRPDSLLVVAANHPNDLSYVVQVALLRLAQYERACKSRSPKVSTTSVYHPKRRSSSFKDDDSEESFYFTDDEADPKKSNAEIRQIKIARQRRLDSRTGLKKTWFDEKNNYKPVYTDEELEYVGEANVGE